MKVLDILKPEIADLVIEDSLMDSYETVLNSIKENKEDEHYTPVYSYERDEEDEKLNELKLHFESVIEWYVGAHWRSNFNESPSSNIKESLFNKDFYLETNQIWGPITSQSKFDEASNILKEIDFDILDCKAVVDFDDANPKFGTRREHNGELTLREWLKQAGSELNEGKLT